MADPHRSNGHFTMDGSYLAAQARDAMRTFVAPFSGVYRAMTEAPARPAAPAAEASSVAGQG